MNISGPAIQTPNPINQLSESQSIQFYLARHLFYRPIPGETSSGSNLKMQGRFKRFLTMPTKVTVCQTVIDRWQRMFGLGGGTGARRGRRDHRWDNALCIDKETEKISFSFSNGSSQPSWATRSSSFPRVANQSPNGRHIAHIAKGCSPFLLSPITSTCQVTPKES